MSPRHVAPTEGMSLGYPPRPPRRRDALQQCQSPRDVDDPAAPRSRLDHEFGDQAVDEPELVAKVDDATREISFKAVADQPETRFVRPRVEERSRLRELSRRPREPVADGIEPEILVTVIEHPRASRKRRERRVHIRTIVRFEVPTNDIRDRSVRRWHRHAQRMPAAARSRQRNRECASHREDQSRGAAMSYDEVIAFALAELGTLSSPLRRNHGLQVVKRTGSESGDRKRLPMMRGRGASTSR